MIVAVAIQLGAILLDPTLTLGKTRKKAMRSSGEPTSAFRATLLADFDGQPHLQKVVNGISFMPPLFEFLGEPPSSDLPGGFTLGLAQSGFYANVIRRS